MENMDCLKVSQRARGVIPSRVSELENDLKYVTEEELDKVVVANQVGTYSGVSNEAIELKVDNAYKTIEAKLLKKVSDDLKEFIPKEDGAYKNGNYVLKVTVAGGEPVFGFINESGLLLTNYYYGNTSAGPDEITPDIVKTLSNGGATKEDKQYIYNTYKQYQVFAYPAMFGELSSITQVETGFNVTGLFRKLDMQVNDLSYYVYISVNSSTGKYTYDFKY